ncbi:glycoside hydrolase family 3 protein [Colletotrichum tofieldiae]|nr:glycoside hydrolase family 3 protein [Colletotrichum tofieldiae]
MQLTTVLSVALLALGVAAQKTGPNGKRICVGGAISCEYEKGRCANICGDSPASGSGTPAFIDPSCSCPRARPTTSTPAPPASTSSAPLAARAAKHHELPF